MPTSGAGGVWSCGGGAIRRGVLRTSLAPAGVLLRDTGLRFRVRRNRAKGQESNSGVTNVAAPVDKRRRRKGKNWGHSSPRSAPIVSLFIRPVKTLLRRVGGAGKLAQIGFSFVAPKHFAL